MSGGYDRGRAMAIGESTTPEDGAQRMLLFLGLRTLDEIEGYASALRDVAAEMLAIAERMEER